MAKSEIQETIKEVIGGRFMKPSVKKAWVKALRSGKYTKGTLQLKDKSGCHCVFGVLCEVHALKHPKIAAEQTDPEKYMGCQYGLPKEVKEWAGFPDEKASMSVDINGRRWHLMTLNDDTTHTFEQIADLIEQQL